MTAINKLFSKKLIVINLGLESFQKDLKEQKVKSMHVNWRPPTEASMKLSSLESENISEKIEIANKQALDKLLAAEPIIVGIGTAGNDIPGMTKKTILHAGPPISWADMCEPLKGAIVGGLIYEKLVTNEDEGRKLAASGEIIFDSCHHHSTVGPMAGVVTSSMPVWICKIKPLEILLTVLLTKG